MVLFAMVFVVVFVVRAQLNKNVPMLFVSHIIVFATLVSMRVRLRIITRIMALMLVKGMANDLLGCALRPSFLRRWSPRFPRRAKWRR